MMAKQIKEKVVFLAPVVGPKVYLVRTSSGWTETFNRKKVDAELAAFVAPLDVAELVDAFITARELAETIKEKQVSWFTVRGYIGRTMGVAFELVPPQVAIAFWGLVVNAMANPHRNLN